ECGVALPPKPADIRGTLEWGYRIPVLSRYLLGTMLWVVALSVGGMQVVVFIAGLVFAREVILLPWQILGLVMLIVFGLALIAMTLLHVIRTETRFRVNANGVSWRSGSRESRLMVGIALLGLLMRKPTVAGAGMLASSATSGSIRWRDISRVVVHPRERAISLRSGWRTVQRVYCPAALFDEVVEYVNEHVSHAPARRRS
ncbi:MAG TPA: hypothetical protein PK593_07805, partial [Thermomicrobiales bacterium]|nr:hypothetical protein [Thermomicrobiales bacterium]